MTEGEKYITKGTGYRGLGTINTTTSERNIKRLLTNRFHEQQDDDININIHKNIENHINLKTCKSTYT